ncbi:poly(U)-specific 3'-to-5' RNA exonuclease [Haplosporangium gracile]|nr:poly(U)-specific 3'-to-5' RNA exonuclease [Haplosporangium gracile]
MPLVDYGSSSDEDENEIQERNTATSLGGKTQTTSVIPLASQQTGTKRQLEQTSAAEKGRKKVSLPPLPSTLTDLYKDRERTPDNPNRHQGRIRARAHVDGSWPVHVYVEVKLSHELFDIVSTLTKTARSLAPSTVSMLQSVESLKKKNDVPIEADSAEDATELHISLTRPIYLQELHLGHFASDIRDTFKSRKRFSVNFSGIQSFSNDDRTRSFLGLRVGAGHIKLESLVAEMDVITQRYSQPKFYPDPQFHASFAWALGGGVLNSEIVDSMSELDGELGHDLRHCSIGVKRVSWKIGQKTGSVELLVD